MLGLVLRIRLELRSGYVRVSAVLGQGKEFPLLKSLGLVIYSAFHKTFEGFRSWFEISVP